MKLLGLIVALFTVASADDTKKGPLVTDKVSLSFFDAVKVLGNYATEVFRRYLNFKNEF